MVKLRLRTSRREEALDVTDRVRRAVAASGVREGTCTVFAPHTTCAIAVNEGHDPAVIEDFLNHIRELVPREAGFEHAEGNSDSHIKALLVGPSATVPVSDCCVRSRASHPSMDTVPAAGSTLTTCPSTFFGAPFTHSADFGCVAV